MKPRQLRRIRIAKEDVLEFVRAASAGNDKRVRAFLKTGMDINAIYHDSAKASETALTAAARNGHTDMVRLLLQHGANPSLRAATIKRFGNQFESDALGLAAEKGYLAIVQLLVEAGANVDESINYYSDALNAAVEEGHTRIVRELLNAGYRVGGPGGTKALDASIFRKNEKIALLLIEAGVDVRSETAGLLLLSSAEKGMVNVVKAMLKAGANPKAKLVTRKTVLQSFKTHRRRKEYSDGDNRDEKIAEEIQQLLENSAE